MVDFVFRLKQQLENIRKRREEEEEGEEALRQEILSEEENWKLGNQLTHNLRKMVSSHFHFSCS